MDLEWETSLAIHTPQSLFYINNLMMYLYATHNVVMVINVNELCGRHNVPRPLQVATRRPSRSEDVADFRSKRPARLEL